MLEKYAKQIRVLEKRLDYIEDVILNKKTFSSCETSLLKQQKNIHGEIRRLQHESGCFNCTKINEVCRKCKRK